MEKVLRRLKVFGSCFMVFSLLILFITAHPASANIIAGPNVAGYTTFEDQTTGLLWLDLNNFFGMTFNQMQAAAQSAGFTVADYNSVNQLLSTLPDPSANWASYAAIMGEAPNRQLIWGGYLSATPDTNTWAWAYSTDSSWTIVGNLGDSNTVANGSGPYVDENIWANRSAVPLPSALLLLGPGLVGLASIRRRFGK